MSDNPNLVNINYTSFAQKEPYKPPTSAFFNQGQNAKKPKYVPGGEWAQDDEPITPPQKSGFGSFDPKPDGFSPNDQDLAKTGQSHDQGEGKPKSKFIFIKNKKDAPPADSKTPNAAGVLEFSEVRSDQ